MEKFINKSIIKFGNKYDYSKINYVNSLTKVEIKCNLHNTFFFQVPSEHLRGKNGCPLCQKKKKVIVVKYPKNLNKLLSNDEFIKRSIKYHGNKFDYSLSNYINSKTKVKIICPNHGIFEQLPSSHIRGKSCKLCSNDNKKKLLSCSRDEFIYKSSLIHKNTYDYSLVEYHNSHTKVKIICSNHGVFEQLPYDHLSKHGCVKCSSSVSSEEKNIDEFLKKYGLKTITSSTSIINPYQLDIFVSDHNLAIEYNGLYWHNETRVSNTYHLNKTTECEKKGIQLIHIFEDEWLFKKEIVKSRLLNLVGLSFFKINGRKTKVLEVSVKDAKEFLNNNHLQGYTNSSVRIGLYHMEELVSIMLFNKPRLGIGNTYDGYELSRFCNKLNTIVIGGADKLLKNFIKTHKPQQIISYADRRWSQGGLYEKLGFKKTHVNKPNYWYILKKNRKHRFGFRKSILKNEGFNIDNKTEHEIMLERQIYRIYDCGTISYKLIL